MNSFFAKHEGFDIYQSDELKSYIIFVGADDKRYTFHNIKSAKAFISDINDAYQYYVEQDEAVEIH